MTKSMDQPEPYHTSLKTPESDRSTCCRVATRRRVWLHAGLAACLVAALFGEAAARDKKTVTKDTPRYLDRYLKAKEGINAEEHAMRLRLQSEIKGEDARMRKVAHVLAKAPVATAHGARLPLVLNAASVAKTDATKAQDFKTPLPKKMATPVAAAAATAAHAAKASRVQQSLARITVKRSAHLKHLLGFAHGKAAAAAPTAAANRALPAQRQAAIKHTASSKAHKALHAVRRKVQASHFDIHTVRRFDPGQSLSFARELFATFALSYADTSLLTGYVGRDIVQFGHYYAMTRFGCALDCNDVHFNGVDGILGLGMPDAALGSIPTPLIFALSNDRGGLEGANYVNERAMHQRKFAFLSTAESGELQLGGYDRASTNADMVYVPTTSTTEYSVNVQSLTFGGIELLNWRDKTVSAFARGHVGVGGECVAVFCLYFSPSIWLCVYLSPPTLPSRTAAPIHPPNHHPTYYHIVTHKHWIFFLRRCPTLFPPFWTRAQRV